ncbi:MAG: hypothetical protein AABW67_01930 [Nanoarchaeota archaeon]
MKKLVIVILFLFIFVSLIGFVSAEENITCADDCSPLGSKRCSGIYNYLFTCGNYDSDSCLEWDTGTSCPNGCSNGACLCPTTKCNDGTIYGPEKCDIKNNVCICPSCPVPNTEKPTATPVQPVQTIQICTDSDNNNFYEKGVMKTGENDAGHWDLCGDSKILTEYYCENNEAKKQHLIA